MYSLGSFLLGLIRIGFESVLAYLVQLRIPFQLLVLTLLQEVLVNYRNVCSAFFNRGEVVVVEYVLGPLPKDDFLPHDTLAVVAQVLKRSLMTATRLPWNWFGSGIAFAEVIELDANKELVYWKLLKVFVRIFGTDLPAVNLDLVAVTNEGCVERYSEYL